MTRRLRPDVHPHVWRSAAATQAWRLGNLVINALVVVTARVRDRRDGSWRRISPRWLAPEYALVPGKLELTTLLTRITLPFLTMLALAGRRRWAC